MKKNVLALQKLASKNQQQGGDSGGVEGGSRASLLLCGDSSLSVVTCN
jgi:Lanthionine-containing peptide SapB precursor RamS